MIDFDSDQKNREKKLKDLMIQKKNPFFNTFHKEHFISEIEDYKKYSNSELSELKTNWKVAGRIIQMRDFGKLIFARLLDNTGVIQILIDLKRSGEKVLSQFQNLDRGDVIGIKKSCLIKSRSDELTILILDFILLAKSVEVLPEKYHGLSDLETRYRQRYLDLIVNLNVKKIFQIRSQVIYLIRNYLNTKKFIEVETPILQNLLTGAAALPFKTFHNSLKIPLYLRVAPELYLKRLVVGGLERIYEIGRLFRNEGLSAKHNPEFTAIEIYQAYSDMEGMMNLTEQLLSHLVSELFHQNFIFYQEQKLNFQTPFFKLTMKEAVFQVVKIDFNNVSDLENAKKLAADHDIVVEKHQETIGHILNLFFEKYVEKTLIQPTFIYEYPIEISPFAKRYPNQPNYTQRFELFINGWEIANAFSELNDPYDQRKRFEMQLEERSLGNDEANQIDEDYILALRYGMPPTGGLGIGIDRLVMLLTNQKTIKDVIFFPTLKPM